MTEMKSKQWSCNSLVAGAKTLMEVKKEQCARREQLEAQKKAAEEELRQMELEEQMALATPRDTLPDTVPASESELAEIHGPKRGAPLSTLTTPVKSSVNPKKARTEQDQATRLTSVKSKAAPKKTPEPQENPKGRDLEAELKAAMKEIQQLRLQQQSPGSTTTTVPSSASPATTKPSPARESLYSPATPVPTPAEPDDEEPDMDHGADEALKRFKMIDARLRRLCERKKNGKCNVPEMLHTMWAAGGNERDKLRVLFEQMELDKAAFVSKAVKIIEKKNEDTQSVESGWFTPDQMKTELKWTTPYIKDVVAYCKEHGLVKQDKYSKKVYKYFVEYSDKESKKKTYSETERPVSEKEKADDVKLKGGFLDGPLKSPDEDGDDSGKNHAQDPVDGEMETEQKFDDGMLAKLSKITDLMSRLETYDGIADGDRKRVQSLIKALETKVDEAQGAYDSFAELRSMMMIKADRNAENTADLRKRMKAAMGKAAQLSSLEAQGKALERALKKKAKEAADAEE